MIKMKKCRLCKQDKPHHVANFTVHKDKDVEYLSSLCRVCKSLKNRLYRQSSNTIRSKYNPTGEWVNIAKYRDYIKESNNLKKMDLINKKIDEILRLTDM